MRPLRVLLYGDVNLNIIDGSSVWLASAADVLSRHEGVDTTVLAKARVVRDVLSSDISSLPRTLMLEPDRSAGDVMTAVAAAQKIHRLHQERAFDVIFVRGFRVAKELARHESVHGRLWSYITDFTHDVGKLSDQEHGELSAIFSASALTLCQTEELRTFLESVFPDDIRRTALFPPIVSDEFFEDTSSGPLDPLNLFYAGKFAPAWGFERLAAAATALWRDWPALRLHVVGDKVHESREDPGFAQRVRRLLTAQDGPIVWHGGLPRSEVASMLRRHRGLAFSVRDQIMDESLELSTKILEYAASGTPVVLNRTRMHEELLGTDYPLFVDNIEDVRALVGSLTQRPEVLAEARRRVTTVAGEFSCRRAVARLRPHLARMAPAVRVRSHHVRRLLVAGHDFKFFGSAMEEIQRRGVEVEVDQWGGHAQHDEEASLRKLAWADAVFCEWCLGNAVWYARRRGDNQRLSVRLHRMETQTQYPSALPIGRVDALITVSGHMKRQVGKEYGWPEDRISVVPNAIDTLAFDRAKLPSAPWTLGLVGMLPQLKRLDRALDVLQGLLAHEDRWRLRVAGPLPFDVPWVWARTSERRWFEEQLERVRLDAALRCRVHFDGRVRNMPAWFRGIGHILSPSDVESFHLGLAEGMASGSRPYVWPRSGARELFPGPWHYSTTSEVIDALRLGAESSDGKAARGLVEREYDVERVHRTLLEVILGEE